MRAVLRSLLVLLLAVSLTAVLPGSPARAADGGDLDLSFSGDGKAVHALAGGIEVHGMGVQPDGRILVAGHRSGGAILMRFTAAGALDTTYADDGVLRIDFGAYTYVQAIHVQSDSRAVIVGQAGGFPNPDNYKIAVARVMPTGALDTEFAGDGKKLFDIGDDESVHGVTVQPDGKIVLVGSEQDLDSHQDFMVARITWQGSLDSSFHGDGWDTVGMGGDRDAAYDVAVQDDGKIVVAGQTDPDGFLDYDFAVARFTATGAMDGTFGGDGKVNVGFGESDYARGVAVQEDGKVVVAGTSDDGDLANFAVARLTTTGSLDTGWGGDGRVTTDFGATDDSARDVAIDANGRIVVGGSRGASGDTDFALARYNLGGSLNTSFGGNGLVVTELGMQDSIQGIFVRPQDGKVVAAGRSSDTSVFSVALARYHGATDPPPDTVIDSGPSGTTSDATPTFAFHSTEAGSKLECRVDLGDWGACTSPRTLAKLADGSHTFRVRAVDSSAQPDPSPASRTFTVDTTPDTTIIAGPSSSTADSTPTFSFSATEAGSTFSCAVDDAPFASCTSPHTLPVQADGPHTFRVRATDSDGTAHTDATPAERSFTVDTVPPDSVIDTAPDPVTTDNTPAFSFHGTEPGSLTCSLDGAGFTSCTSPKTLGPLGDGPHTFAVAARDSVGNVDPSPAVAGFTIDTLPPETTITSGPSGPTRDATPTFGFQSNEPGSTFACWVDAAAPAPCTSPFTVPAALSNGTHTFRVQATDSLGHPDATPAQRSFRVDTVAPNTVITAGPSGTITRRTVKFWFGAVNETAAFFECRLDDRAWRRCSSPKEYADLSLGFHTFRVRAYDKAGNRDPSPAVREFRIVASTGRTAGRHSTARRSATRSPR